MCIGEGLHSTLALPNPFHVLTTYKLTPIGLDIYLTYNDDPLLKIATIHTKKTEKEIHSCKTSSKIQ